VSRRAVIALGLIVVVLVAWLGYRSVRPPTPGPLANDDIAESLGLERRTGQRFTFGMPVVINSGDDPAVLERIEPVDPTPGLRLLRTRVAGAKRKHFYFASGTWPDPTKWADVHPVSGFVVQPETDEGWERGAELLFIMRADRPGRYEFDSVAVEYRVGGNEHRAELEIGLAVCVVKRPTKPFKGCSPPSLDET
jgi:hypothetical protein